MQDCRNTPYRSATLPTGRNCKGNVSAARRRQSGGARWRPSFFKLKPHTTASKKKGKKRHREEGRKQLLSAYYILSTVPGTGFLLSHSVTTKAPIRGWGVSIPILQRKR